MRTAGISTANLLLGTGVWGLVLGTGGWSLCARDNEGFLEPGSLKVGGIKVSI